MDEPLPDIGDYITKACDVLELTDDALCKQLTEEQEENHWSASTVDYSEDPSSFKTLPKYVQELLLNILAFTIIGDVIIIEETEAQIYEFLTPSEQIYFAAKQANEAVHAETYIRMVRGLESLESLKKRCKRLFGKPAMFNKIQWLKNNLRQYGKTKFSSLAVNDIGEMVSFRGVFLVVDYSKFYYPKAIPGVVVGNGYIRSDENKHGKSLAALALRCDSTDDERLLLKKIALELADIERDVLLMCHQEALKFHDGDESVPLLDVECCDNFPRVLCKEALDMLEIDNDIVTKPLPEWARGVTSERTNFYEAEAVGYKKPKRERVHAELFDCF